jgi:DNA mismatch repair protein MutS
MALVKEYFELTKKYQSEYGKNTVVLMQVGAFFEVYGLQDKSNGELSGSEIADFSRVCDLNIADKKVQIGQHGVVMAGFGHYMIDKYLKRLQENGYTVVVYAQDADDVKTRNLVGIFSPGTYFSHEATHITNNTMAIWVNVIDVSSSAILKKMVSKDAKTNRMVQVGIANIDIYTGKSSIFEFKEIYLKTPTTFDELERFVSIYKPSEVLIIGNINDSEMDEILNYANIECNSIHKISLLASANEPKNEIMKRALNSEKQIYQKELFSRFYKMEDYDTFSQNFYANAIATQAFCFLLDFIYQHNPNLVNKISEPKFENCGDRLILANHSLKQLNIIDEHGGERRGKLSSVEKMLNICITSMGKRRFSYHFLNPTTDISYLRGEYEMIEHMLKNYGQYHCLPGKLAQIKDIAKLNRQIIMKKISPKALYQFYKNLFVIDEIYGIVSKDNILLSYLASYERTDTVSLYCKEFISFFESTMDMSLCEGIENCSQFEINFFKKNVDTGLDEKAKLLLESMDKLEAIRDYFNKTIEKYEKKSAKTRTSDFVKLHETEKNHFSLLSTKRRCTLLKQSLPSLETVVALSYKSSFDGEDRTFDFKIAKDLLEFHNQTASNDTINMPIIKELCKNVSTIKVQMKDLLTQVYLKSIVSKLEECQLQFERIIEFVTILDFIYAKTAIVKKFNYCKPVIQETEKSFVNAKGLRHCLIEHIQQNELYVANDIQLGKAEDIDGILLYGTNAVGKTSFIRALGIAVVMAQAGLYVPCNNFEYSPYKYIFTRILGNDDIHKGLSTFAVEMSELRTILRLADKNSLILGDELCSGTESVSAKSIFVAGVQMLAAKQSSFIFATHLHEIATYDEITDLKTLSLKHMEVIYDKERDLLVYDRKLKDGPGDNMYGLEVCKALSLPPEFLEAAHNIRMKYQEGSNSVLSLKSSHFNSKKLVSLCEMCKSEIGKEVHHLQHQKDANEDGFILAEDGSLFHKNHPANLMSLCEKCHDEMHRPTNSKVKKANKKVKTSVGVTLNIF